ncbi:PIR Superfamily Protein [Plasmodium ovale wallikeri]|uniref:PIR Superfamily Protein n=1 Tax=Plasmodium ovale wallikeri TaxID=864142 RepID=A0A1A9AQZ4_PLAOA|nr:PIR Superfamily Protein [Plasmodium ovale wallikeri]SBT58633.1 PIR Superfamily Protein [Plasmodium ovale wallikeri]
MIKIQGLVLNGQIIYAFLDNIDEYEPILENAEKITAVKEVSIDEIRFEEYLIIDDEYPCPDVKTFSCETLLNDDISSQYRSPHIICEQFKFMYHSVITMKDRSHKKEVKENDYLFLNYWLNDKLSTNSLKSSFSVKDFYKKLQEMDKIYFSNNSLEEKLNNIESYHLENMKILLDLYKLKNKIYRIISEGELTNKNSSWLEHKNERNKKYKEGIIKCHDGCNDFHNALKQFKCIYEYSMNLEYRPQDHSQYKELFELPDHYSVIKEYSKEKLKSITTVSFLVPVFGLFFMLISSNMFLPIQNFLLEKIKNTKNKLFTVEERENELLSYTSYNNNRINDEEDYNIGYYSVRNL